MSIAPLLVGGGLSLLGGVLGGSSAKSAANAQVQAGRDALNQQNQWGNDQMLSLYATLFGPDKALEMWRARVGNDQYAQRFGSAQAGGSTMTQDEQREMESLQAEKQRLSTRYSGPTGGLSRRGGNPNQARLAEINNRLAVLSAKSGGTGAAANPGTSSLDQFKSAYAGQGTIGDLQGLADQFKTQGDQLVGGYDTDTASLLAQSKGLEDFASGYGKTQEGRIERDAGRSIDAANRRAMGMAAASGMGGGSLLGSQMAANAKYIGEGATDQKNAWADQMLKFNTALKGNTLNLNQSRLNDRMRLLLANRDSNLALQQQPITTKLNAMSGNAANPFMGVSASPFFSGASPSAGMSGALAGTAGALGGNLFGAWLQGQYGNNGNAAQQQTG